MKDNILRLNPIFALFEPARALMILLYIALFAVVIFLRGDFDITFAILAVLMIIVEYHRWTKEIYLERGCMEFIYYHSVRGVRSSHHVKTLYSAKNIQNLKFEQNPIEKLFGAGHFSFTCQPYHDADKDYYYDINPKTSFTFYGLSNFKNTKKEICNILGVNESE